MRKFAVVLLFVLLVTLSAGVFVVCVGLDMRPLVLLLLWMATHGSFNELSPTPSVNKIPSSVEPIPKLVSLDNTDRSAGQGGNVPVAKLLDLVVVAVVLCIDADSVIPSP